MKIPKVKLPYWATWFHYCKYMRIIALIIASLYIIQVIYGSYGYIFSAIIWIFVSYMCYKSYKGLVKENQTYMIEDL